MNFFILFLLLIGLISTLFYFDILEINLERPQALNQTFINLSERYPEYISPIEEWVNFFTYQKSHSGIIYVGENIFTYSILPKKKVDALRLEIRNEIDGEIIDFTEKLCTQSICTVSIKYDVRNNDNLETRFFANINGVWLRVE